MTTASCDTCHNTLTWTATTFDHSGVAAGTCATCHNGVNATGKPATHIPTTASCDTCHTTVLWKPASFPHDATMVGQCSTCHNGRSAMGKATTHIPTTAQCDTCHTSTTSFLVRTMNHTGLAGQCLTCHNGAYLSENAQTKSVTHIATTQQCDSCHKSTTSWATATFNHALAAPPVVVGDHTCANCHKSGGPGLPKPTNHIPTVNVCDTCHTNFVAFRPAVMNHDGTAGQCSTCHSGAYVAIGSQGALAKPASHIATTAQCDTCHRTEAWKPATYVHDVLATGRCSVCHNGVSATGKGTTHIPDNRQCDTCHTSTTSFTTRTMNHTGLAGQCLTCHNGAYLSQNAQTKSPTHLVTTAQCDTCHTSTISWATAITDHSKFTPPVIVGDHTCANCHRSGGTGLPKPTNHIPTTGACDTCHKNFIAFRPASMDHTGTAGQCSTCHNGAYVLIGTVGALAKPATHIATTAQCDTCHTTAAWKPATGAHDATSAGRCSTCHNGITATGKGAGHIPDARQCDTCHTSTTSFLTRTMNHTGLTSQCSTCHSGAYVSENAQTWPGASHQGGNPPAQCDTCHKSTTTWATATVDHSKFLPPVIIGDHTCANCHKNGGTGLPKPTSHIPTTGACDTCHTNFVAFRPAAMNHTGTAGQCSTCHNGSYVAVGTQGALAKPATHISTTAQCDTCHTTVAWKPATFTHSGVAAGTCASCHNGTTATGKPTAHIPTTQSCDGCHRTIAWLPLVTPYAHTGIAAGTCSNCHSAGYINVDVKPASHIPTTAACDACHRTSAWLPLITPYSHTGIAPGTCTTCHTQPYTSIVVKTGNHIPTTQWPLCDTCHKSYTSFANARLHTSVTVSPGTCATCHERANPYGLTGRPSGHRSGSMATASCDASGCHTVRTFSK